jgi:hypothetical protein
MTHDKIVHYIGKEQVNFICIQPTDKLKQMKKDLLYEFNEVHPKNPLPVQILFRYTIELELINNLLKN